MLDRWFSEKLFLSPSAGPGELISLLKDRGLGLGDLAKRMTEGLLGEI